ncbi:MAG TPA: HAD family hydrolase [Bacillales bacterium]
MAFEKIDETKLKFKAVILELENVIAETAPFESAAWKRVAGEYGVFVKNWEEKMKEQGESGIRDWILEKSNQVGSGTDKQDMLVKKEAYYEEMLRQLSPKDVSPGIEPLLKQFKKNGVRIAAASARKNAESALENLEIGDFFDEVIDEADISNEEPLHEKVLAAAKDLDTFYKKCIAIIDVRLNLIQDGETKLFVIGVGNKDPVEGTDWTVSSTGELTYEGLKEKFIENRK